MALLHGGKSGPAIVPGRPDESLLIKAVLQTDPKMKMPMGGGKLTDKEIADLRYWIQAMAAFWPTEDVKPAETAASSSEKAPAFTLKDQNDRDVSLESLLKKGPVALVFYRSADW